MMTWEIAWLLVREHVPNGPALGASSNLDSREVG